MRLSKLNGDACAIERRPPSPARQADAVTMDKCPPSECPVRVCLVAGTAPLASNTPAPCRKVTMADPARGPGQRVSKPAASNDVAEEILQKLSVPVSAAPVPRKMVSSCVFCFQNGETMQLGRWLLILYVSMA